ncbi:hypothetical protein, partial [Neisseria sp.]|uniref:hypothetical protein n=1 Tax=Neisseria sp. TaxID=192066 RepID=UPI0026DADD8A
MDTTPTKKGAVFLCSKIPHTSKEDELQTCFRGVGSAMICLTASVILRAVLFFGVIMCAVPAGGNIANQLNNRYRFETANQYP